MTSTPQPVTTTEAVKRPGRWLALSVLVLAVLLVAVDATVLGLATPYISEDLKPSGTQLLWIGDVYSFVIAGLLVSMGSLGDRIGRKRILLGGATAFGAISILNAYATTPELMILARALLGVAGATLMPATLALIRNLFHDPRERSLAVGIWGATASAGTAIGPIAGGFLLEHFWWGSVFLINLPVMAVLVLVGIRTLPESRNPNPGPWDLISVVLSLVGVIGVVYAVKEAATHGVEWPALAAGALGAAALYWFVRRQLRLPAPLLDMRLFRNRGFSAAVLADLLTILGLSGLVFFLSQYLQLVQGRRPFEAGLAELPAAVGAVAAGLIAGRAARRFSVRSVVSGGLAGGPRPGRTDDAGSVHRLPRAGCGAPGRRHRRRLLLHGDRRRDPLLRTEGTGGRGLSGLGDGVRTGRRPGHRRTGLDRDGHVPGLRRSGGHSGRGARVTGWSGGGGVGDAGRRGTEHVVVGPGGLRRRPLPRGRCGRRGPAGDGGGGVVPAARPAS